MCPNATNAKRTATETDQTGVTTPSVLLSFGAASLYNKAANPKIAARKLRGISNGTAAAVGTDVVCEAVTAETDELALELEDSVALLLLVEAELVEAELEDADSELADVELADSVLPDVELAEEAEAVEAVALPVSVAIKPV